MTAHTLDNLYCVQTNILSVTTHIRYSGLDRCFMNLEEYFEQLYRLAEREKTRKAKDQPDRFGRSLGA